jgi:predicted DNA-binding helix-hairpin-helix protein
LIETAELLRFKLGFQGYLHLKVMPGAEKAQVERAMQLADRVSVNLEAPNSDRLLSLAPHKHFAEELLRPLEWVNEIRNNQAAQFGWKGRWPSSVTQFVAGGSGESDVELLATTQTLYRKVGLKRAYFSPFHPISDTPLKDRPPTPALRGQRLYQASFLLRDYGFEVEGLAFEPGGWLPIDLDPKQAWACVHLHEQPLEVNRAERGELLRIPGIGPKSADAILKARRSARIKDLSTLRTLGVFTARAAPFLLLNGHRSPCQDRLI